MFTYIANNWGTILVGGIVLLAVILVVVKMIRDKRAGKSSCGCGTGCSGCSISNACGSYEKESDVHPR